MKPHKIVAIGDIHGKTTWNHIIQQEDISTIDKLIFVGDYFDTYDKSCLTEYQIMNFQDILKLKKEYPDKVVILIGNHEYHYLIVHKNTQCSGYQFGNEKMIENVVQPAYQQGLIQLAYSHNKFLFTHAGVTRSWIQDATEQFQKYGETFDSSNLEGLVSSMNDAFLYSPMIFNINDSPLWVRPTDLMKDAYSLNDCKQVVGHTWYDTIQIFDERYFFIDSLKTKYDNGNWKQFDYLTIVDDYPAVKQIYNTNATSKQNNSNE